MPAAPKLPPFEGLREEALRDGAHVVAQRYGCTKSAITKAFMRAGQTYVQPEIVRQTQAEGQRGRKRVRVADTPENRARAVALYNEGKTYREIQYMMNMQGDRLRRWLREEGVIRRAGWQARE